MCVLTDCRGHISVIKLSNIRHKQNVFWLLNIFSINILDADRTKENAVLQDTITILEKRLERQERTITTLLSYLGRASQDGRSRHDDEGGESSSDDTDNMTKIHEAGIFNAYQTFT